MKAEEILIQYVWIIVIGLLLIVAGVYLYPTDKNKLDYIEEKLEQVQKEKEVLTQKEQELKNLATEKEWEEVDKDTNK